MKNFKILFSIIFLTFLISVDKLFSQIPDCPSMATQFFDIEVYSLLYEHNDLIYFFGDNGVNGAELWISDGTEGGTYMLKDICLGSCSSYSFSITKPFLSKDGSLFFIASNDDGKALWVSDGTPQGTVEVKKIDIVSTSTDLLGVYYDKLFLKNGDNLIISDGTEGGTYIITDVGFFNSELIEINEKLYFTNKNKELWTTDGTEAGTHIVKEIEIKSRLFAFGNKLLFAVDDELIGAELWISDGTENGTSLLVEINETGSAFRTGSISDNLIFYGKEYKGNFYFAADDGNFGIELWSTDGTAIGTKIVKDIYRGAESSTPLHFTVFRDKLFFQAKNFENGAELWYSDGTKDGTILFEDFEPNGDFEPFGFYLNQDIFLSESIFFPFKEKLFLLGKENRRNALTYMLGEGNFICNIAPGSFSHVLNFKNKLFFTTYSLRGLIYVLDSSNFTQTSKEFKKRQNISVYPNPATEEITIDLNDIQLNWLRILDITGREILREVKLSGTSKIDIGQLNSGVYFIEGKGNQGERYIQKMLKL